MAQKQGPGFMSGVSADTRRYVRELKNKVYNYTEMEQMVRECTCNDTMPPNPALMREIAKGTFTVEFPSIMALIWKRVKDRSNENHPLKCLILLEFLLREGNADMVMKQIQKNLVLIEQLKHFTLYNEHQQDLGTKVRMRADAFLTFLRDGDMNDAHARSPTKVKNEPAFDEPIPDPVNQLQSQHAEVDLLGGGGDEQSGDPFGGSGGGSSDPFGGGGGGSSDPFGVGSGGGGGGFSVGHVPAHIASTPVMKLSGPAQAGRSRQQSAQRASAAPTGGPIAPVRRSVENGRAGGGDLTGSFAPQPAQQRVPAQQDPFGGSSLLDAPPSVAGVDDLTSLAGLSLGGGGGGDSAQMYGGLSGGYGGGIGGGGAPFGGGDPYGASPPAPSGVSPFAAPQAQPSHAFGGMGGGMVGGMGGMAQPMGGVMASGAGGMACGGCCFTGGADAMSVKTAEERAKEATNQVLGAGSSIVNLDNLSAKKEPHAASAQPRTKAPGMAMAASKQSAVGGAAPQPMGMGGMGMGGMAQPMGGMGSGMGQMGGGMGQMGGGMGQMGGGMGQMGGGMGQMGGGMGQMGSGMGQLGSMPQMGGGMAQMGGGMAQMGGGMPQMGGGSQAQMGGGSGSLI
ncbi:hypothetical protein KFE25_000187 [Diacronema lutheri]|uniref:ENTH domain-containing protein n=2 Tax=Diacronema lutheri TaxID=2081491 RepID=A0A8J6C8X4_DIALT|nr:hypothetical protein KFE25_000187 [Diacronema lutheri]